MVVDRESFDVVIVGAGPAGSSAAAVLAEKGRRVALLEKARFPRYRVGESLIPYCWFPLNRLGVIERLDRSDFVVHKHSVQFVGLDGRLSTPFYFSKHTDHDCARTWQVVRSEFDQMLLDNAAERGAQLFTETQARSLLKKNDRVVGVEATQQGRDVQLNAPVTIDASGRDLFAAQRNGWRVADADLKKIAMWAYYRGAVRDSGLAEGATTVAYLPQKGWFWYIPLPDDTVSVGVVAEKDYLYRADQGDPQAVLDREIQLQPWIREHLEPAERISEVRVTGDYSYRSKHCASDGLVLAGDAFAFLDPVFSSGVFLALQSGILAGDAVDAALTEGDVRAERFEDYGREFRQGLEAMRRLVYAFYDQTFSFGNFLKAHPDMQCDLTDCLIGNVYKDLEPLFEAVSRFAKIPAPLSHGRPLVGESVAGNS
ncbi:MAG: NAD(P)/FAD-dependent oxidoreductase [Phycisphaeraceae bacterium]|nr:NAD(P)/FAD-dependent oxidoreductase [Phycisphaeraceae bacterium]